MRDDEREHWRAELRWDGWSVVDPVGRVLVGSVSIGADLARRLARVPDLEAEVDALREEWSRSARDYARAETACRRLEAQVEALTSERDRLRRLALETADALDTLRVRA